MGTFFSPRFPKWFYSSSLCPLQSIFLCGRQNNLVFSLSVKLFIILILVYVTDRKICVYAHTHIGFWVFFFFFGYTQI
jgi:hypothetical protein